MSAFLGVPIHVDGALLGAIYLTKSPGEGAFGATDEVFVSALAGQAGHAVTMVRALAQSEDLAHRLGVAERLKSQAMAGLSNELDPGAAVDRILAAAQATLGMELAFITRIDGDTQHLVQLSERRTPSAGAAGWRSRSGAATATTW
jgi:GAF domain-containing protein